MIICSVSGFFIILKTFTSYKRFVFAAAFFFSPLKSRIIIILVLYNAVTLSSTPTAPFTLIVSIAFAAFIAQLSPLRIIPAVIPSFRTGLFLSPPPLPPNAFTAAISPYSRFNSPKPVSAFTQKFLIFRNLTYSIGQVLAVISFYYIARRPFRALVVSFFIATFLRVYRVNPFTGYLQSRNSLFFLPAFSLFRILPVALLLTPRRLYTAPTPPIINATPVFPTPYLLLSSILFSRVLRVSIRVFY